MKKGLPPKVKKMLLQSLALGVLYVAISGITEGNNTIITIGGLIGEVIDFDGRFKAWGDKFQAKMNLSENGRIAKGFVDCSLFVCAGTMTIVGSLQSGMTGDNQILFTKAIIDGVFAMIMASTLGIGVSFGGVSVLVYEGILTLFASQLAVLFPTDVVSDLSCVGAILILGIGLNMLDVVDIKVANLMLAPFVPVALHFVF